MPIVTFRFTLTPSDNKEHPFAVQLALDETRTATAPFHFDLTPTSRLNLLIAQMRDGIVSYDQLQDIGANLFKALVNGKVAELFNDARTQAEKAVVPGTYDLQFVLRLELPIALRYLPWECLYEEETGFGFLLNRARYSLVRETHSGDIPPRQQRPDAPVRMLAVIPCGSNLNVEKELHGLELAVEKLGQAVELKKLDGRVTADRMRERVDQGPWDIVHFIGHGDVVDGRARIRLNHEDPEADDQWVHGEIFATFFERNLPRLVVLNCCHGGSSASLRSLSGVGPFLRRAGVPAVVAMQYEIPDSVAIRFAAKFYSEFLTGSAPGRIDRALAAARLTLFQNQTADRPHSFMTPVLYLQEGHETLLELTAPAPAAPVVTVVPGVVRLDLPNDLITAFKERRIVPILGPELLSVGAMRSGASPPPGPRALARLLAEDADYPRMRDFDTSGDSEDAGSRLLPEVCQHYERRNERWKLLMAVQNVYSKCPPPPVLAQIARWNVPGVVCSYFDGLLDEAMTQEDRRFRSLLALDQKAAGYQDETLVVHVRGMQSDGDSLVLTERDEEQLLDRMGNLSPQVMDLTRKSLGRSLLYLGVPPRDPLVRRLTRALRGNFRGQGPMYFVSSDQTTENAYWDEYHVRWLPFKLEDLMLALGNAGL